MSRNEEKTIWTSLGSVQSAFRAAISKEISYVTNSDVQTASVQPTSNESYVKLLKPPTETAPRAPMQSVQQLDLQNVNNLNILDIIHETNQQLRKMHEKLDSEIKQMKLILCKKEKEKEKELKTVATQKNLYND